MKHLSAIIPAPFPDSDRRWILKSAESRICEANVVEWYCRFNSLNICACTCTIFLLSCGTVKSISYISECLTFLLGPEWRKADRGVVETKISIPLIVQTWELMVSFCNVNLQLFIFHDISISNHQKILNSFLHWISFYIKIFHQVSTISRYDILLKNQEKRQ